MSSSPSLSSSDYTTDSITPEELQEIPKPLLRLSEHVFIKGIQAGSIIGNTIGIVRLLLKRRHATLGTSTGMLHSIHYIGHQGVKGAIWISTGSLIAMNAKLYQEHFNEYRIWDRAYRLKHNESQNRCDTFSLVGGAVGFITMLYPALRITQSNILYSGISGATIGISSGVILHALTNPRTTVKNEVTAAIHAVETNVQDTTKPQ